MHSKNRILIVDDEAITCSILKFNLEKQYEVDVAYTGQEALQKIEKNPPDCLLLDYRMPNMDGLEVLNLVKPKNPDLRIIMVTAVNDIAIGAKCILQGAFDYIVKPANMNKLKEKIKLALEV